MSNLKTELQNVGLKATLKNTGGGVMVYFVACKNKFIGIDEYSVVLYDSHAIEQELVYMIDDSLHYTNKLKTLANMARLTYDKEVMN